MRRLATDLAPTCERIIGWQGLNIPGFLFDPIAQSIDSSKLLIAETTFGNLNVLFELGYAIGAGKHVVQLIDENAAKPRRLPPLDIVRQIRYTRRPEIVEQLAALDYSGDSLLDAMGIDATSPRLGSLYVLPARNAGDTNDLLVSLAYSSPFDARTIDVHEIEYESLTAQARSIATAQVFSAVLVSEETRESWDINAQVMLYAGIAAGLKREYVVLSAQPLRRVLDLGDRSISFRSDSEAEYRYGRWLQSVARSLLTSPPPERSIQGPDHTGFQKLFFGSLDARADFELGAYFIETPEFHQAESGARHLFVGAKGAGKTANFVALQTRFRGRNVLSISISPSDFEFPRLAAVFDECLSSAHWEFVYGSFWRFILITEMLRQIKHDFLDHLLREAHEANYASALVKWIHDNDRLLERDFVSRVTVILEAIKDSAAEESDERKRMRIEDALQIARMYDIEEHLRSFARKFELRLFVDDLDRNWSPNSPSSRRLIISFLNEVLDLMRRLAPRFRPAVFLRGDVFAWLRSNDQEIMKRDPAFLRWTKEGLENLIAERIATQLERTETDPERLWDVVFPRIVEGQRARDFIIDRTHLTPREVIQFCQHALELAQSAGRTSVAEQDVVDAWERAGETTLAQIEVEYRFIYPALGEVVLGLMDVPAQVLWSDIVKGIEQHASRYAGAAPWIAEGAESPRRLIEVLYRTGVVGFETAGGLQAFETHRRYEEIEAALGDDFFVIVHPAFQRYLNCHST